MPGMDILSVLSKDPSDVTLDSSIENQCPIQARWIRHLQSQDGVGRQGEAKDHKFGASLGYLVISEAKLVSI